MKHLDWLKKNNPNFQKPLKSSRDEWHTRMLGCTIAHEATRTAYINSFGFSVPTAEMISAIAAHSPILEVGAGTGYTSKLLMDAGADVIATDSMEDDRWQVREWYPMDLHVEIEQIDMVDAVRKYPDRNVLISWPRKGCRPSIMLDVMTCEYLFYVGENHEVEDGVTADDAFHAKLYSMFDVQEMDILNWYEIHDKLYICRRKENKS